MTNKKNPQVCGAVSERQKISSNNRSNWYWQPQLYLWMKNYYRVTRQCRYKKLQQFIEWSMITNTNTWHFYFMIILLVVDKTKRFIFFCFFQSNVYRISPIMVPSSSSEWSCHYSCFIYMDRNKYCSIYWTIF